MAYMEKFEAPKSGEKFPPAGGSPDQIAAARHLEDLELKRNKEARVQGDVARIAELKKEIQPQKIELDYSKMEGAVINQNRRGSVLAAESAHAKERPEAIPPIARPLTKEAPSRRKWWERIIGRDQ